MNIWWVNHIYRSRIIQSESRLFWWEEEEIKNFGDLVGPYLFQKITGEKPQFTIPDNRSNESVFLTVGSILSFVRRDCIVWGSGIINSKETFYKPYKTLAVRGHYTRKRFIELSYPCPEVFGDPAILLPRFYRLPLNPRFRIGIVPNYIDYKLAKMTYGKEDYVIVINPLDQVENVVNSIVQCEYTACSSLHGTIISHAYGIPSIPIKLSNKLTGDGVKFKDYYSSVEISYPDITLSKPRCYSVKDLIALVEDSTLPKNITDISEGLIESCPYKFK